MKERLAAEIMDAANNNGASVKNARIRIRWLRLIRPLRITAGRINTGIIRRRAFFCQDNIHLKIPGI